MKDLATIASTLKSELWIGRQPTLKAQRAQKTRIDVHLADIERVQAMWTKRLHCDVDYHEAMVLSAITNDDRLALRDLMGINRYYSNIPTWLEKFKRNSTAVVCERTTSRFLDWAVKIEKHFDVSQRLEDMSLVFVDDMVCWESDTWYCDHCGCDHSDETNSNTVVTEMRGTRMADSATACDEMDTFYCTVSDRVYDLNNFNEDETTDGETCCREFVEECGDWRTDRHGDWYQGSDTEIPSYHDADRSTINRIARDMASSTEPVTKMTRRFGLEVEFEFNDADDRESFYDDYISGSGSFIAETDGSLDDDTGLEVISQPITYEDWLNPDNSFIKLVRRARESGASGWCVRNHYGVHVNMDLRGLTEEEVHLTYAAVNNMGAMWELFSGRKLDNSANYTKLRKPDKLNNVSGIWDEYHMQTSYRRDEKYQPINIKNGYSLFAEIRSFGSNLREGALLEYIQLCSAVVEWVKSLTNAPEDGERFPILKVYSERPHALFLTWLDKQEDYDQLKKQVERWGHLVQMNDEQIRAVSRN